MTAIEVFLLILALLGFLAGLYATLRSDVLVAGLGVALVGAAFIGWILFGK